jgi:predicted HAD superfamily phosphohydrolase YqeG
VKTVRIAGDDYPADVVRSRLLKITSMHIEYVFDALKMNTGCIRNIKKYLLAAIFNAASTMDNYYFSKVNSDFFSP